MVQCVIPVGAIIPYAGPVDDATPDGKQNRQRLLDAGWLVADGSPDYSTSHGSLYKAIGQASGGGGPGSVNFNHPDLRGRFVRVTDLAGLWDKDRGNRTYQLANGNTGDAVGSFQTWATGLPAHGEVMARIAHLPDLPHHADKIVAGAHRHAMPPSATKELFTCESSTGGDSETRPTNAYVSYLLASQPGLTLPAGAIVSWLGQSAPSSSDLLPCDGTKYPDSGTYQALFAAIGKAHGWSDGEFNVPDYRGQFLRGATTDSQRDPDTAKRTAMAKGGLGGSNVGSIQGWATGRPTQPFSFTYQTSSGDVRVGAVNDPAPFGTTRDLVQFNDSGAGADIDFFGKGASSETAPVNMAVDYYIVLADNPDWDGIGSFVLFCGDGTMLPSSTDGWQQINTATSPTFSTTTNAELWNLLGNPPATDGMFSPPQPSGAFLRGRDPRTGTVPGAISPAVTAPPSNPISGTARYLPHTDTIAQRDETKIHPTVGVLWPKSPSYLQIAGGDSETRPNNVYCDVYIKFA